MEMNKVNPEEQVGKNEEQEHSNKGAFASSMIFVGGFIFLLYIAIYWLYMAQVNI
ncbi:hypothetical protein [Oceanobacillus halotolerans]|uniref:hypothetical protein n=1 Tax=Oceanobacillus halotolerans TaxID=2663380 RepID=UPI0013DCF495|nr:hypothetical protein [Oceanobacillus halotolerans]